MTHGEYEVYEATGRLSMCCPTIPGEGQKLIDQLRRHWQHRNNGDKARINSRWFCYEAVYKLRYWRFHFNPDDYPPQTEQLKLF